VRVQAREQRYFQKSTLFGSLDTSVARAEAFQRAGANELACMIDFGVPLAETMSGLEWLARLHAHVSVRQEDMP
jgi:hypothetical protein